MVLWHIIVIIVELTASIVNSERFCLWVPLKLIIYFVSIINKAQIVDITAYDSSHNIFKIAITKESTEIGTTVTVTEQHFFNGFTGGREGGREGKTTLQNSKFKNDHSLFLLLNYHTILLRLSWKDISNVFWQLHPRPYMKYKQATY